MVSLFYLFCVVGHFPPLINTRVGEGEGGGVRWFGYVFYDKRADRNNKLVR